jgi:hypothetical protein
VSELSQKIPVDSTLYNRVGPHLATEAANLIDQNKGSRREATQPNTDWLPMNEVRRRLQALGVDASLIDKFMDVVMLNRAARLAYRSGGQ